MEPDPTRRPQSAAELAAGLRQALSWRRRGNRWARQHPLLAALLLMAGLLTFVAGAALWITQPTAADSTHGRARDRYREGKYEEAADLFATEFKLREGSDKEGLANSLFGKGRALQRAGHFEEAREAYRSADRLRPDPRTKAALAYCLNRLTRNANAVQARDLYSAAMKDGFATPAVLNNRAVSWIASVQNRTDAQGELAAAERDKLDQAAQDLAQAAGQLRGADLQVVLHNQAWLDFQRSVLGSQGKPYVPSKGLAAMEKALVLAEGGSGQVTSELYADAARLAARVYLVGGRKAEMGQRALRYAGQALDHGWPVRMVKVDWFVKQLSKPPVPQHLRDGYKELTRWHGNPMPTTEAVRVLDPLEGNDDLP
jgi:tetratricopeptide (TPR) repeat protein